jgi:hypothetical protein
MEPQLPDFACQVAGVGLAEIFGALGEQADQKVHPAEVMITQLAQPGSHFGLDPDFIEPGHASDDICICCYSPDLGQVPEA